MSPTSYQTAPPRISILAVPLRSGQLFGQRLCDYNHQLATARILSALIALAAVFRLWNMTSVCLDGDEIFSVLVSRQDWARMTAAIAADSVHPPLFYYLLHLWMRIG